jgi:hypothetical protein
VSASTSMMTIWRPTWAVSVRCTSRETKLLVTDELHDVLKARLSSTPRHPRALVTLCEGLALWHGAQLHVAVSAEDDARDCFERIFYADGLVEPESPLVMLEHRPSRARARRRLCGHGLGDFRGVRRDGDQP